MLFGTETHSTLEYPEKIFPGGQHFARCDSDDTFVEDNISVPSNMNLIVNMMYDIEIIPVLYAHTNNLF